jgi:tetratricopeptide (TPR) repeat protein
MTISYRLICAVVAGSLFSAALMLGQGAQRGAASDPYAAKQMHDAIAAAQGGDEARAIEIVRGLVAARPRFGPGLKLEGMLLEDSGQAGEAAEAYEAALKLAPNDAELLLKAGSMELVAGKVQRAAELLRRRLRLVPGDEDGSYYLAQALHLEGDNDGAVAVLKAALKKGAGHPASWQKLGELLCSAGQYTEALTWLEKAQKADGSLARLPFDLAVAHFGLQNLKEAEAAAGEEARAQPGDVEDLMLLATVRIKLGEYAAAAEVLQGVVSARPNDAAALVALGHCQVELKEFPAAIDTLGRALQVDPTQTLSHFFLSRAYAGVGKTDESQHEIAVYRELQQHLAFAPGAAEAKRNDLLLAQARGLIEQGDEAGAFRVFQDDARGVTGTTGSPWVLVGSVYLSMGRIEDAQRVFLKALQVDAKTPDANAYLGNMALEAGDLSRAEGYFNAERERDANHVFATAGLGAVQYRQGKWQEAADLIARSKTTDATLLYLECDALFRLGLREKAVLVAEAVATYGRGNEAVGRALDGLLRRNGEETLAVRLGR